MTSALKLEQAAADLRKWLRAAGVITEEAVIGVGDTGVSTTSFLAVYFTCHRAWRHYKDVVPSSIDEVPIKIVYTGPFRLL